MRSPAGDVGIGDKEQRQQLAGHLAFTVNLLDVQSGRQGRHHSR